MNDIQIVKAKQKQINQLTKDIEGLQKKCPHKRIKHRSFPDSYMGQGTSSSCMDCGKFISCASFPTTEVVTKTWIESKK
jgi:hypothetical protein